MAESERVNNDEVERRGHSSVDDITGWGYRWLKACMVGMDGVQVVIRIGCTALLLLEIFLSAMLYSLVD